MGSVVLSNCFKCIKYSMFVFCLFAWLIGLITLIVGIVTRVTGSFGYLDHDLPAANSGANLLIAVGFFIMLMGLLGCCGTIRESQCLLFGFFLFVFFCFTLLMAAGLWAVSWQTGLEHYVYRFLEKHVDRYDGNENTESTKIMDYIQHKFDCCGITSSADYIKYNTPSSCIDSKGMINPSGCHKKLIDTYYSNLSLICGIGIGFAVLLVSGMVCSMMMCCALREIN